MRARLRSRTIRVCFYLVVISWICFVFLSYQLFYTATHAGITAEGVLIGAITVANYDVSKASSRMTRGTLHLHTWPLACEFKLRNLKEHPLFSTAAQVQQLVHSFNNVSCYQEESFTNSQYLGHRVFGYLQPPVSGNYAFSLSVSANDDAELSLSEDKNPQNNQLLCEVGAKPDPRNKTQRSSDAAAAYSSIQKSHNCISRELYLKKNSLYFIKLLHLQNSANLNNSVVRWRLPGSQNFAEIERTYLLSYAREQASARKLAETGSKISRKFDQSILENTKFFKDQPKYLDFRDIGAALTSCPYEPGYTGKPVRYHCQTVQEFVNPTFVFPEIKHNKLIDGKWIPWFPLDEQSAVAITDKYMKYLDLAYPGRYRLQRILNVERKTNWLDTIPKFYNGTSKDGDRYLLELQLRDNEKDEHVILSQYVYDHYKKDLLCYLEGIQWDISTPVYLLISVRKQGAWIQHLIRNLEKIYQETRDENLYLVLYDYNTTEMNIERELARSSFKKYKVLQASDAKYSRAFSLNRAAETIADPHAIIFTLDLHLEIPSTFPNNLRKHCIKGRMVYTPIIARLACGATPGDPAGDWDPWGYGMFGAYKSDWDRFHGFDEERFGAKWGGEDWDLLDRAYKVGLEFERIKHADFYHYYHTRKGMW